MDKEEQGTNEATNNETGNAPGGDTTEKSGEKLFTQEELDRIVTSRLERERAKADEATRKAKEAAEAKALEEQQEYQKLAEQRAGKIAELEPQAESAKRYQDALTKLLATEKTGVPEHVLALLDKLDPVEQLEWIAANREKLKPVESVPETEQKPRGVPATPSRGDQRGVSEEQKRAARVQSERFYRSQF